jgi:hypothetical protein
MGAHVIFFCFIFIRIFWYAVYICLYMLIYEFYSHAQSNHPNHPTGQCYLSNLHVNTSQLINIKNKNNIVCKAYNKTEVKI